MAPDFEDVRLRLFQVGHLATPWRWFDVRLAGDVPGRGLEDAGGLAIMIGWHDPLYPEVEGFIAHAKKDIESLLRERDVLYQMIEETTGYLRDLQQDSLAFQEGWKSGVHAALDVTWDHSKLSLTGYEKLAGMVQEGPP